MWHFRCDKYPQLIVCVGGDSFIAFSASLFETEDSAVAEVLKKIDDITLIDEPVKDEAVKKAAKKAGK